MRIALLAAIALLAGCSENAQPAADFGARMVAAQILAAEKACSAVKLNVLDECTTSNNPMARRAAKTAALMTATFGEMCGGNIDSQSPAKCENMLNNAYAEALSK